MFYYRYLEAAQVTLLFKSYSLQLTIGLSSFLWVNFPLSSDFALARFCLIAAVAVKTVKPLYHDQTAEGVDTPEACKGKSSLSRRSR